MIIYDYYYHYIDTAEYVLSVVRLSKSNFSFPLWLLCHVLDVEQSGKIHFSLKRTLLDSI